MKVVARHDGLDKCTRFILALAFLTIGITKNYIKPVAQP